GSPAAREPCRTRRDPSCPWYRRGWWPARIPFRSRWSESALRRGRWHIYTMAFHPPAPRRWDKAPRCRLARARQPSPFASPDGPRSGFGLGRQRPRNRRVVEIVRSGLFPCISSWRVRYLSPGENHPAIESGAAGFTTPAGLDAQVGRALLDYVAE